jgi:oxygen-independent coproporphyrinogen III oxidase
VREGLENYEISNFALGGFASKHNLKYWQLEPYVGFGLDAHSFDGRRRWANPDTLPEYLEWIRSGNPPPLGGHEADPGEEHFFVGLRQLRGITPTPNEWERFRIPIERGISAGLLERSGERLRLTARGVLASNEILQEFIA